MKKGVSSEESYKNCNLRNVRNVIVMLRIAIASNDNYISDILMMHFS